MLVMNLMKRKLCGLLQEGTRGVEIKIILEEARESSVPLVPNLEIGNELAAQTLFGYCVVFKTEF